MEAVIRTWGNSLGVRIPGMIARALSLRDGSPIKIVSRGNDIVIKPAQKYCLAEMLDNVTDENMHEATDWGRPVGKEIW